MSRKDLTGQRFGKLTVIRATDQRFKSSGSTQVVYECLCDCGNTCFAYTGQLTRKDSRKQKRSCGCLVAKHLHKHGGSKTALYSSWTHMKSRCYNPNTQHYARYGGRGITICNEWLNDFAAFRDWALSNGYKEELTLDRIDVNGNYCPENCRWATWLEQKNNMRSNRRVEYNGEIHTVAEWSRIVGIPYAVLIGRFQRGWAPEKALTEPFHAETPK